jgi:hypothetical protein
VSASVDSGTRAVIDCALLLHLLRVKLINLDTARNEVRVLKYAPPRYDAPPRAHGQLSLFTASAGSEWGENVWSPQIPVTLSRPTL